MRHYNLGILEHINGLFHGHALVYRDVAHVAMLLFVGYIDAATSMSESCGGRGSAPESGWGKKDDEDERQYARRCLQMAHSSASPSLLDVVITVKTITYIYDTKK